MGEGARRGKGFSEGASKFFFFDDNLAELRREEQEREGVRLAKEGSWLRGERPREIIGLNLLWEAGGGEYWNCLWNYMGVLGVLELLGLLELGIVRMIEIIF